MNQDHPFELPGVRDPGAIDAATPQDAADAALGEAAGLLFEVRRYLDALARQVHNAAHQDALDAPVVLDADTHTAQAYADLSPEYAFAMRAAGAVDTASGQLAHLRDRYETPILDRT